MVSCHDNIAGIENLTTAERKENSAAKLLRVYLMKVYEDGTVLIEPFDNTGINNTGEDGSNFPDFSNCSSRITQVLNVLIETAKDKTDTPYKTKISKAIFRTAQKYRVNPVTVIDKCSRQLDLSINKFKDLVNSSIESGDSTLEAILISKAGTYTRRADEQAIKQTFYYIKTL